MLLVARQSFLLALCLTSVLPQGNSQKRENTHATHLEIHNLNKRTFTKIKVFTVLSKNRLPLNPLVNFDFPY